MTSEQLVQLLPLVALFGVFYFVMILPAQRKNKAHRELLENLTDGTEVVLSSGIHGFVSSVDADVVWVELADGLEVKVSKSAIASEVQASD